jgi:hypothetical protein
MNHDIFIVDRQDQVDWYLDPKSISFYIQIRDNKREIREWLAEMTSDVVVICGQGKLPRRGTTDHPTLSIYEHIYRDQYRLYFANDQDAMAFKIAWGGSL